MSRYKEQLTSNSNLLLYLLFAIGQLVNRQVSVLPSKWTPLKSLNGLLLPDKFCRFAFISFFLLNLFFSYIKNIITRRLASVFNAAFTKSNSLERSIMIILGNSIWLYLFFLSEKKYSDDMDSDPDKRSRMLFEHNIHQLL